MTNEEYYKIREQRHSRWKNMTDVQRKEIDDKLVERDRIYAEIEEYRKQGRIHPAEIEEAKKILSWRYNVRNTGSDIMMEDLIEMEAYAKDVLKRAGEIMDEEKKQTLKRLDDESERCYQQMKNWVETKKWDNGSDIDPVSYERIVSDYNKVIEVRQKLIAK